MQSPRHYEDSVSNPSDTFEHPSSHLSGFADKMQAVTQSLTGIIDVIQGDTTTHGFSLQEKAKRWDQLRNTPHVPNSTCHEMLKELVEQQGATFE